MKKILFTLLLTITAFTGFAQSVNFGLKGGFNLSNQSISGTTFKLDGKSLIGFHFGAIAEIGFANISLQPGVFFSTKGYKSVAELVDNNQQNVGTATYKTTLNYIEIPVNVFYNIKAGPGTVIYLGGGPFIAYGISGNTSGEGPKSSLHFGKSDEPGNYKNPDYGINIIAGVKILKTITLDAGYGLGLGNITYADGATLKNKVISFSVGYLF